MLPRRLPKGQVAFRRLKVFIGVPFEFKDKAFQSIAEAGINKLKCPYVTVGEYAKEIGYGTVGE
jgi:large subunit ribosomal protein L13